MSRDLQSESNAAHGFREEYGDAVRYVPEKAEWLVKEGPIWVPDRAHAVDAAIRCFLDTRQDADARWKGSLAVVRNIKGFAERDAKLHARMREVDVDPMLLGLPTTIYDLEGGAPLDADPRTYITKAASVDPDFASAPHRWLKFLKQVCQGDQKLIDFLQRWCGYLLTGSVKEHALLVIYGPGGNGKSVLVNTVATIMGSYHREAVSGTFVEGKRDAHETAMAHIAGARFVTSGETDQEGVWNEGAMKRAVGGDPVTARFLFKNPFTYRPTFKIWISTNHLPRVKSVGPAMRRRVHLLELSFVPSKPDVDLEQKLAAEHGAILAWMLEGTRLWLKRGLKPPKSVRVATDDYFDEQDTVGSWLKERTRVSEGATPTGTLCASYNSFLRLRNLPEVHPSVFGRTLSARGYESKLVKPHNGGERTRCFVGIKLRTNT